jgi:hypothetical protein
MSVTTLKFFVRENDNDFSISQMSEPESAAIQECIDDLIPHEFQFSETCWVEADTCFSGEEDDEDEPTYGRLRCFTHNPHPRNGSIVESRLPFPIPQALLQTLAGKTFQVYPRQLGLNPWGKKVEVVFEAPPVKSGIKASALIAAALKAQ